MHNLAERYRQELHAHGAASRVAQPKLQLKVGRAPATSEGERAAPAALDRVARTPPRACCVASRRAQVSYADRSGFYLSISLAGKGDPAALLPSLDLPK